VGAVGVLGCLFLAGVGVYISIFGIRLYWSESRFAKETLPVNLLITGLVENRDGEGSTFSPVFLITEGEFAGRSRQSAYGSGNPIHAKGERSRGFFEPATGRIESSKSSRASRIFAVMIVIFGVVFTGGSLVGATKELAKAGISFCGANLPSLVERPLCSIGQSK
jgi:hypothetical protein